MIDLTGKSAIVTGGGSGIGKGIGKILALAGADVVMADKDRAAVEVVVSTDLDGPGEFLPVTLDVTDSESIADLIDNVGAVDILVNNAGIVGAHDWWKRENPSDDDWEQVFAVNVMGMVKMSEAVSPYMKKNKYGKIVNIASTSARQGSPDLPHYSSSKAAVVSWTQSNAHQLAPHSINVNAICPGLLWTPMWESISRKRAKFGTGLLKTDEMTGREIFENTVESWVPLKREQTPQDIGYLAAFLASDISRNITGQAINVDGGRWMN